MRSTREISLASPGTFDINAKEGEELRLTSDIPKSKKERIAELEKELKELKSQA